MNQEKRRGLGRGLESLLPPKPTALRQPAPPAPGNGVAQGTAAPTQEAIQPGEIVREIALDQIDPSPYQTRGAFPEDALAELAESIKSSGVLQPIVVRYILERGRYQIIAGERRWRASQRAGKKNIPALVRQCSNEQALVMTIVENLQREDLNPMDEARGFERLLREFGLTQEQVAEMTGKPRSTVANYLRLLRLPLPVQDALRTEAISFGHAKALMMLPAEQMAVGLKRVLEQKLSVRQVEELVEELLAPPLERPGPATPTLKDANVKAAARELQAVLGLKVTIRDRKGKGKVIIEYRSLEDFDRIIEQMKK